MLVYLFINAAVFSILHKSSFVEYVTHPSSETQKFIKFLSHEPVSALLLNVSLLLFRKPVIVLFFLPCLSRTRS